MPGALVGFAADAWRLVPGGGRSARTGRWWYGAPTRRPTRTRRCCRGAARPLARPAPPAPAPVVLDCDEVGAEPGARRGRPAAAPAARPCRCCAAAAATPPRRCTRLVRSGYAIALWRREPVDRDAVCADFHRGIARAVRAARTAGRLPGGCSRLRAEVAAGMPETYWSNGLTLLYDDPTGPYPEQTSCWRLHDKPDGRIERGDRGE